jgi:hypothetical protein
MARLHEESLRTGRGPGQGNKTRLLDNADQNIGNALVVNPDLGPTIHVNGNPPRIINLDALSPTGQMMTITLSSAHLSIVPVGGVSGNSLGGPIVGIVEFGNGSQVHRVEIDVPMGPIDFTGTEPQDGGTAISVPTGTLRVYARNDGNLIPVDIAGNSASDGGTASNVIAANGPRATFVKAQVDYLARTSLLKGPTRTVYMYNNLGAASAVGTGGSAIASFRIPPFAKAMRVLRLPQTSSMTVRFFDPAMQASAMESIVIAAGNPSPLIDVPGQAVWFNVASTAGGDTVTRLMAEFQIGL